MTRTPLPKFVKEVPGRRQVYLYFRQGRTYLRLPDDPASADFHRAYAQALANTAVTAAKHAAGSVAALVADYKASPEYKALAATTQRSYARQLDHLVRAVGTFPAAAVRRSDIIKLRNKIVAASGERTGDLFVAVASRCYGVGIDLGYCDINPAADIERIATSTSYPPWPADVRAAFEASHPPQRLAVLYAVALWTALRLSDAARLGRQHDDGTTLRIRAGKTSRTSGVEIVLPVRPELRGVLDTVARDRLLYITDDNGRPMNANTLSKHMAAWLKGIGVTGYTVHGLRHTTGTALADAGASAHEIQAILGHTTLQMAERYTRRADRTRLAATGIAKLGGLAGGGQAGGGLPGTRTEPENGKHRAAGGKHPASVAPAAVKKP